MCFWGNVPVSLLCTGTPRQVKDDVKELVELFGDTGAYARSGSASPTSPAGEPHALREAVEEYGVF